MLTQQERKQVVFTVEIGASLPKDIVHYHIQWSQHNLAIVDGINCYQWTLWGYIYIYIYIQYIYNMYNNYIYTWCGVCTCLCVCLLFFVYMYVFLLTCMYIVCLLVSAAR